MNDIEKKEEPLNNAHDEASAESQTIDHTHGGTLHRVYNIWTATLYQVLMMASWTCNVVLYDTVFTIGGPMMLIYSTIIVTLGQCLMMASLGELCSVWPYAGGQQAFTKYMAPTNARRVLSYIIGWIVFLAEVATSAGCAMNNAQLIGGLVNLTHPDYAITNWLTWIMYTTFLLLSIPFSMSQKHLPAISVIGGVITLAGFIAWAVAFLVMAPKMSARFVFTELINSSGYNSVGWVGIMSFYTPVYALYGTDGILHLAEEMKDPSTNAPKAMIWAMLASGASSLAGAIVLGFTSGHWEQYMDADSPLIAWWVDVLESVAGGSALVVLLIILLNFLIVVSINTAASRVTWSMAKDRAFPFSDRLIKINKRLQTPLNAIFTTIGFQIMIGLVVFGSRNAFETIVSLGGVAIQIGYFVPVALLLLKGRSVLPADRAYNLGRFGYAINIGAVCWAALIIIMLCFPLVFPITSSNLLDMNWSIAVFAAAVLLVLVDWILRARFHYQDEISS
ncbi:unnamed protein product [Clonostachys byssicola]|uniref:Uncharacterized protein n=1 Tax=Clonostachys byssicola TaxID=160290 RepID=A0A9N9XXC3_9HYPO|nr:unnamed protein product [Clonostachys byssicola]